MFMEGSLLSVALSFLAFCFAISLLSTWWLKVKELYAKAGRQFVVVGDHSNSNSHRHLY